MIKELENLGLTKNEADIYTICLKKGSASAFKIAQSSTIPTTTVYNVLKKLAEKGLISTIPRKNKKYYEVNDPKVLKSIKEQELEDAKKLIPSLSHLYMKDTSKSQVRHYSETEGIKTILDEMIEEATELMIMGSVEEEVKYFQKYFPRYIELRINKKIPARIITEDNEVTRELSTKDVKDLRKIKFLDSKEKVPSIMYIWSNRLVVISFGSKVNITSIEDKNIYQLMKRNFEMLWGSL